MATLGAYCLLPMQKWGEGVRKILLVIVGKQPVCPKSGQEAYRIIKFTIALRALSGMGTAQWAKEGTHILRDQFWLFPVQEMTAA